jgi:adenylate cyclase
MSGDPEPDYFADGMVEDIVTGLSRIKWLFVIARNSSFVYKGKAVDVRQAGRELGVRYLVEGGVRKSGSRLRVTAQLVEAETGADLWADRFDGELKDVFDFQDRITDSVVGIVEPSVRRSEIERSRRKRPENLDVYDLYLRALPLMATISVADAPSAAALLRDAVSLDPNLAVAHAYISCLGAHGRGRCGGKRWPGSAHWRSGPCALTPHRRAHALVRHRQEPRSLA